MLIYTASDRRTSRRATVELLTPTAGLPYQVAFFEGDRLDHTRRCSTAGLGEGMADEWCNYAPLRPRHYESPRARS